MVNKLLHRR